MIPIKSNETDNDKSKRPCPKYSISQVITDNLPYMVMTILGASLFIVGLNIPLWKWFSASLYILYSILGALWIILFICPYCHYYGTHGCPCGYGLVSQKLRPKKNMDLFRKKFKQHIPVIYPLWIVPAVAGIGFLIQEFSSVKLVLLILFAIDAFIILPFISKKVGCTDCPQKDQCPWMTK